MSENNVWDKFDENVDTVGLAEDVSKAAESGAGDYKEVPHGMYEVSVEKMELIASKKGDPMVSIWFKVVGEGEFKGSFIFFNQVITQGFQVHIVNELLRSMETEIEVDFKTYKQYGTMLMDMFEAISGKVEFALDYTEGKKGFSKYKITEVYDLV